MTENDILSASASPAELERLYRADPGGFTAAFPAAFERDPSSLVLVVWRERLFSSIAIAGERPSSDPYSLAVTIVLSLLAGSLVKLPAFLGRRGVWYYPRFTVPLTVAALILYFLVQPPKRAAALTRNIALACLVSFVFLGWLPDHRSSDTTVLAMMHMPLVLVACLGVAFCGQEWRAVDRRIEYLRYWAEMIVYATLLLLGGMVLTGMTFSLFAMIDVDIGKFYMNYVVVYGIVASPIVGTFLYDAIQKRQTRLAPMLANVFAPLFLITVVVYLFAMAMQQKSPFSDRDFLVSLNGLLVLVLAITILSVAQSSATSRPMLRDVTNVSLVVVTLMIDAVALSAIVFRLSSMGATPNRFAVLGTNVLVFVHLSRLLARYVRVVRTQSDSGPMDELTARYMPWYSAWTAFVAFAFPLLFRFA